MSNWYGEYSFLSCVSTRLHIYLFQANDSASKWSKKEVDSDYILLKGPTNFQTTFLKIEISRIRKSH